jgi:hypothetical protein
VVVRIPLSQPLVATQSYIWIRMLGALRGGYSIQLAEVLPRYAENRPNTSQVANAINAGRGLP